MKIGVLGTGRIVQSVTKTLQKMDGVECYAIASRTEERAREAAAEYGYEKGTIQVIMCILGDIFFDYQHIAEMVDRRDILRISNVLDNVSIGDVNLFKRMIVFIIAYDIIIWDSFYISKLEDGI